MIHRRAAGPAWSSSPIFSAAAIDQTEHQGPRLLMSPRGERLTQGLVRHLAAGPGALIICGRFEGVDERVIERRQLREVSLGGFRPVGR
jgi:tRNA (guanine37-N1)-methyltransferase